jgi:hypothetical protein
MAADHSLTTVAETASESKSASIKFDVDDEDDDQDKSAYVPRPSCLELQPHTGSGLQLATIASTNIKTAARSMKRPAASLDDSIVTTTTATLSALGRRADKKRYLLVENMDLLEMMAYQNVRRKLAENPIVAERVVGIIEQTSQLSAHMVDYLISGFAADYDLRLDSDGKQSPTGNYDVYAEYMKTWPKKLSDPTSRGIRTIIDFKGHPVEAPLTQWKCLLWFCSTPAYLFGIENVEAIRLDLNTKKNRVPKRSRSLAGDVVTPASAATESGARVSSAQGGNDSVQHSSVTPTTVHHSKGRGRGRVRQLQSVVKIVKCPLQVSFDNECAVTPTPTASSISSIGSVSSNLSTCSMDLSGDD